MSRSRSAVHSVRSEMQSLGASGVTAIISDEAWKNYFDGDADVIGRAIEVNGVPATIIGVAPPAFHGTMLAERSDAVDAAARLLASA